MYGGCAGTVPFTTLSECLQAECGRPKCFLTPADVLPPPGKITCAAYFTSWFYNRKKGVCESFSYSGCSNVGPFTSAEQCESARCRIRLCSFGKPTLTYGCELGKVRRTWYYDLATRRCQKTPGDKCSNGQVFASKMECRASKCYQVLCDMTEDDVTYQSPSIACGPPPRPWVFNKDSGACEQFVHEGCETRLPFRSEKECSQKCLK